MLVWFAAYFRTRDDDIPFKDINDYELSPISVDINSVESINNSTWKNVSTVWLKSGRSLLVKGEAQILTDKVNEQRNKLMLCFFTQHTSN